MAPGSLLVEFRRRIFSSHAGKNSASLGASGRLDQCSALHPAGPGNAARGTPGRPWHGD
jgi:hypothetical protein